MSVAATLKRPATGHAEWRFRMPSGVYQRPSVAERFWAKVEKTEACWLWTGSKSPTGYGHFYAGGYVPAHRFAYEMESGTIPPGLEIDHLCRTRHCVRCAHLEAVTHAENVRRAHPIPNVRCPRGHPYVRTKRRLKCFVCQRALESSV